MKITMLGVGNGFSKGVYDNNALVWEEENEYAMIDCGTTAWTSLDELNIKREAIKSIFVTHIHFDHTGGIESAGLYGKFVEQRKMRLIVPKPIKERIWDQYLKGAIEDKNANLNTLEDFFEVVSPEQNEEFELCKGIKARWFPTNHIKDKFSCGIVINDDIMFTSDTLKDEKLVNEAVENGMRVIFHDCHFKQVGNHASYDEIKTYSEDVKKRLYLMHHGLKDSELAPKDGIKFIYQHEKMEV